MFKSNALMFKSNALRAKFQVLGGYIIGDKIIKNRRNDLRSLCKNC